MCLHVWEIRRANDGEVIATHKTDTRIAVCTPFGDGEWIIETAIYEPASMDMTILPKNCRLAQQLTTMVAIMGEYDA